MKAAIDETDRRRAKQKLYNEQHSITPRGIKKIVKDILEVAYEEAAQEDFKTLKIAEHFADNHLMTPAQLEKQLTKLQKQMQKHAKNLEFEKAAHLRDEIKRVEKIYLVS